MAVQRRRHVVVPGGGRRLGPDGDAQAAGDGRQREVVVGT